MTAVLAGRLAAAGLACVLGIADAAPAPPFELPLDSGTLRLDSLRGKVVYIDFWASWCGPCKRSFPWMNKLQQRYAADGLQVVAINVDEKRADAAAFLARVPASFTVAYDPSGAVAKAYAIKGMPSSALVGRDGQLLWLHTGFNEADSEQLEAQVRAGLQQR